MSDKIIVIYTDGACSGNPGPGGYAAVMTYGDARKFITGGCHHTTNNRMELMAIIEAISAIRRPMPTVIRSDSEYVTRGMERLPQWESAGWKTAGKSTVKNQDLWAQLRSLIAEKQLEGLLTVDHVKGHAGDEMNELCDRLARQIVAEMKRR